MKAAQILHRARAAGVIFSLTPSNRLRLGGDPAAINLWLGEIGACEAELIAELSQECAAGLRGGPLETRDGSDPSLSRKAAATDAVARAVASIADARKSFGVAVAAAASRRSDADAQILSALAACDLARAAICSIVDADERQEYAPRVKGNGPARGRPPGKAKKK